MRTVAVFVFLVALLFPAGGQGVAGTPGAQGAAGTPAAPGSAAAGKSTGLAGPDLSVPTDGSAGWKAGFSVFATEDLSPQNTYLASSIPLLLRDGVSGLTVHTLDAEERDAVRRTIAARAIDVADLAVTQVRREHDALLFSGVVQTDAGRKTADDKLRAALARQAFLRTLDLSLIEVDAEKPVTIVEGTGQGKLLDTPRVPPSVYCARQGLDLLVGGTISEVQGYLLVDIWVFSAASGTTIISARDAAQREDLYADLSAIGVDLTGAVLGRDWSLVTFAPEPAQSSLRVDGVLVASGASPAIYLEPGTREIRVSAAGYDEAVRTLTLVKGGTVRIEDSLKRTDPGTIEVASEPAGAALYVDSRWLGVTPLTIDRPAERSRAVVTLDGYYPVTMSLGPGSAAQVSLPLPADKGPRDLLQQKARSNFYASFAWFALSLPIPLASYAFVFDYGVQHQDFLRAGMLTEASTALNTSEGFLVGYYGGVALSVGLFAWMVVRIVQYVAVANGIAG